MSSESRKESQVAHSMRKDVSIKLKRISGGRFEAEITIEGKHAHSGRAVVLTSPRSLAFQKKA